MTTVRKLRSVRKFYSREKGESEGPENWKFFVVGRGSRWLVSVAAFVFSDFLRFQLLCPSTSFHFLFSDKPRARRQASALTRSVGRD